MSEVFSDDLLGNVREINKLLRSWRASRLESAAKVNSAFDVRVNGIAAPGSATGFDMIVPIEPSRVALLFASQLPGVYLVPGSDTVERTGFMLEPGHPLLLTIHNTPGLVSMDWYFGAFTISASIVYAIEILDRRRR
jgi:hypothetical protein